MLSVNVHLSPFEFSAELAGSRGCIENEPQLHNGDDDQNTKAYANKKKKKKKLSGHKSRHES